MPKIIFLSSTLYNYFFQEHAKFFGGVSSIFRIVKKLSGNYPYKVYCLVGDFGQKNQTIVGDVTLIKSRIDHAVSFYQVLRQLARQKADLIVDFYASPRLFLLFLLKKIYKQKYVFFVGSDIDVNGGYSKIANPVFNFLYIMGLKRADRVICQTAEQAEELYKRYKISGNVIVSTYVEITEPLINEKDSVIWVGRSVYYKGPLKFLDLAGKFPEEKFVMISNPSDDLGYHIKIKETARKLKNVTFYEIVPPVEMNKHYSRAKFLVNTSDFEGFPNTFAEAGIEKTPILSLNVNPDNMLGTGKSGYCCQGSMEKLVKYTSKLLEDPGLCGEMGKNAREYVETFHDINISVEKISAIFDEVIGEKR